MRSLIVIVALLVAGCADPAAPVEEEDDFDVDVEVDETTGAIRGVVVDQTIFPIAEATVELTSVEPPRETLTDSEGRFAFSKVPPGSHILKVSKLVHESVTATANVEAGVADSELIRIQMTRLSDQDPFISSLYFQGHFGCAYNAGISSTCVNDYTRLNPTGHCPGGCFPQLASLLDTREYVTVLDANWQSIQVETVWEPSLAGTSDTMGMTISYFARPDAQHNWGGGSGSSPLIERLDFPQVGGTQDEFNEKIPDTGLEDLFVFFSAGFPGASVEQSFEVFHTHSYYAPLPDGWALTNGDEDPF